MDRSAPTAKPRSILVVEDEFPIAMELEAISTAHGFVVVGPVGTVAGALELLNRERPDAAVLDVNLRGTAVTPVARTLREMKIPFVASAYVSSDIRRRRFARSLEHWEAHQTAAFLETLTRVMSSGL